MKKTFLLGSGASTSVASGRWGNLFIGSVLITNGIRIYAYEDLGYLNIALLIATLGAGLYAIILVLMVFTDLFGTAPKVVVSNNNVLLKSRVFKSVKTIDWSEIKSIGFHAYQIDFKLETAPVFFDYRTSAKVSRLVKDAIRDMAELKNVPVTGG